MGNILNEQEVIQAELKALEENIEKKGRIGIENRKYTRRIGRWPFEGLTENRKRITGYTENVSEGGVLLIVNEFHKELERNKKIYIEIKFSYKGVVKKINTLAKIKHVVFANNGKKIGLEYINIEKKYKKILNTYANYKF